MSHELASRADGSASMAYTGDAPWHGLGQSLPEGADLDTWTVNAGMDFAIEEAPVLYEAPAKAVPLEFKGRKVLYRADTLDPLGDVSSGYKAVQPREVMEFFRSLTEAAGFRMETAGVLYGGKKYWALARVTDDLPVLDLRDKVGGFLLLSTSADGSMATQPRWTTVRVVCRNTLTLAIGRDGRGAAHSVPHRSRFDADAAKAALGLTGGDAREAFAEGMEALRRLARTKLSRGDAMEMTLELFGIDRSKLDAKELVKAVQKPAVVAVSGMGMTGQGLVGSGLDGAQGTAWAWVNAVTQYFDHMTNAKSPSNRLDRAWFGEGERTKNRAFAIAAGRSAPPQGPVDLAEVFGLVDA